MRSANVGVAVVVLVAGLSACSLFDGGDPCDKADAAARNVTEKSSDCTGLNLPKLTGKAECETAVQSCSTAEKAVLDEEMACLENVGACVPGQEQDFVTAVATCAAPVAALSSACRKGFGL